ncbi:MAG: hypothetical protein KGJ03_12620 [Betaproteobacteria bacterium]|nr:hypothetical protein [Betaproteobacteria bacterium]MDE1956556.1 hypothetical protein [Betaproteobacteria bacterium]
MAAVRDVHNGRTVPAFTSKTMTTPMHTALQAWGRADFAPLLRDALLAEDALFGPLQKAMAHGSHALVDQATLMLLRGHESAEALEVELGVGYASISPGCACEGDPTPMSELPEYATLRVRIDRASGSATVTPVLD